MSAGCWARLGGRRVRLAALLLGLVLFATACSDGHSGGSSDQVTPLLPDNLSFWDNPDNWPTSYGPAFADVLVAPTNFVPCVGGPYALCYYSGPDPLPCTPTQDGRFANCSCVEIAYGPYYVLMTGILNYDVYLDTVEVCGDDGARCAGSPNLAPVCQHINDGTFLPGADLISTFSFACLPEDGIGQTPCGAAVYAGCMTAACTRTDDPAIVTCQCPTYDGLFQVGNFNAQCDLPGDEVWSAAYSPDSMVTAPTLNGCVPDGPGDTGCPLLGPSTVLPPDSDCAAVCKEYNDCKGDQDVQVGYTCDATLCTSECNDQSLVGQACNGLSQCDLTAIIALEKRAECSCCASQLCGCQPSAATNAAIAELNAAQEAIGITTQCQINGTLCGD